MTDDEARAILRTHDETPPDRGRLSAEWRAKATHYADQDTGESDYEAGVTDADFTAAEAEAPPAVVEERRPRRVRAAAPKTPSLRDTTRTLFGKGPRKPKAKVTHKRVPVDRFIGRMWEVLGGLAGRVDVPLGRCLQMQAPVAGLILEDVVKGTAADRAIQPLARAEEKAEKVIALAAPPMIVLALEYAAGLPPEQRQLREAILVPMLEESMTLWVKVAGDKLDEQIAREAETAPARQKARELMELIFARTPDTVEEQAA
jgi:hypothetical protein